MELIRSQATDDMRQHAAYALGYLEGTLLEKSQQEQRRAESNQNQWSLICLLIPEFLNRVFPQRKEPSLDNILTAFQASFAGEEASAEAKEVIAVKPVHVGDVVRYVDPKGQDHNALVTAVWGNFGVYTQEDSDKNVSYGGNPIPSDLIGKPKPIPSLNLVYVSDDPKADDSYGRQIAERPTSVVHHSAQQAHGSYWEEL